MKKEIQQSENESRKICMPKAMNRQTSEQTGFPSIDKPWRQYYTEKELNIREIPSGTMYDFLFECNKDNLQGYAIEYYGTTITYKELFNRIDACCRSLSSIGLRQGDTVTMQCITTPQVVILLYALNKMGVCISMLYPNLEANDVVASLEKTHSKLFIVIDKIFENYEEYIEETFDIPVLLLNVTDGMGTMAKFFASRKARYIKKNKHIHSINWNTFTNNVATDYTENHNGLLPAFLVPTGGTTGTPKEVVLSSSNINCICEAYLYTSLTNDWKKGYSSLLLLPPFIAFGISSGIHLPMCFGAKLIISIDVSPAAVSKLFLKYKPNHSAAGTVQIEKMISDLTNKRINLESLKILVVGGEAIKETTESNINSFLLRNGCAYKALKGYGMTEIGGAATSTLINADAVGSVGVPNVLCNLKIIDPEKGTELSYGQQGEICLSTQSIMIEYYDNPKETNEIIEEIEGARWIHTGDIGFISKDGLLTITDRIKRIVVIKEGIVYHKVYPNLLEDYLLQNTDVKEIAIVARNNADTGNELVAYYTIQDVVEESLIKQLQRVSEGMKSYERPKEFIKIDEMPRTLIGKVNYKELERMATKQIRNERYCN